MTVKIFTVIFYCYSAMARVVKPLTAVQCKNAKPKEKQYRLYDGNGLYLQILPSGRKSWRVDYVTANGKNTSIAIGHFPDLSLEQARKKRIALQAGIEAGDMPSRRARQGNSFFEVAKAWHEYKSPGWSEGHAKRLWRLLEVSIIPFVGGMPITDIKPVQLLELLRKIEERGKIELAHRTKIACSQVFRYAVAAGICDTDPTQFLTGAMIPVRRKHFASVTDPQEVSDLLKMLWAYKGSFQVEVALKVSGSTPKRGAGSIPNDLINR